MAKIFDLSQFMAESPFIDADSTISPAPVLLIWRRTISPIVKNLAEEQRKMRERMIAAAKPNAKPKRASAPPHTFPGPDRNRRS